jgi:hypothetical protein
MRDLVRRIWRYLNYAPNTHGKVEEIRQGLQRFFDDFPRQRESFWNVVTAVEQFRTKVAAMENDLRYLKTMVVGLQNQVNSLNDHLRSSQPWLPSPEGSAQKPEACLLASLASFFPNPIVVNIGANDDTLWQLLLDAGFEIYTFESEGSAMARLAKKFSDRSRFHILDTASTSMRLLAEEKEITANFPVLRITTKEGVALAIAVIEQLSPEIVETAFSRIDTNPADEDASGRKLIREMRTRGYHWNLLMFRIYGAPAFRFAASLVEIPDMAAGHLLFFKNFEHFEQAYRLAQLVLPRFQHGDSSAGA